MNGSDSDKDKDEEEDYEVDNKFFVPHGHLSDEEMQMGDDVADDNSPEAQKAKLKILQQEFAAEMKKKTEKIKPRLIGCIWMNGDEDENGCSMGNDLEKKYHCSSIIWRILKSREMMTSDEGIKLEDSFEPEILEPEDNAQKAPSQPKTSAQQRVKIPDTSVKELIKLVHGNVNRKKFILREFQAYRLKNFHKNADFQEFSVKSVEEKMMEVSDYKTCPEEGPLFGKKCYYVKPEAMRKYYGDEELKLPNEWKYILEKDVKEKKPKQAVNVDSVKKDDSSEISLPEAKHVPPENKPEEVLKAKSPPAAGAKKRVQLLMSVPRGQEFSETKKNNLMSLFLKGNHEKNGKKEGKSAEIMKADEVVVID